MSEELIKKSDAIDAIYEARRAVPLKGALTDTMSWAIARANAIPTIEPKRGEWIDDDEHSEYYWANCSVCGLQIDVHENRGYYNFCPNCGANMRGEDNEID